MKTGRRQLGKRLALDDSRDLLARDYLDVDAALAQIPQKFGHGFDFHGEDWLMLGNGDAGDCLFAGGAHEEMIYGKVLLGEVRPFTDESVLSDYTAVTGYDPRDPATDQGAFTRDVMSYRQKVGLLDSSGKRHKIGPYLSIDPKDWRLMLACVLEFGVVGIGIDFPDSAFDQFEDGKPWDVVKGADIEGGHYVPIVGSSDSDSEATVLSWARRQILTRAFYAEYNDEAWTYVPGTTRPDGTALRHVDVERLERDLQARRSR